MIQNHEPIIQSRFHDTSTELLLEAWDDLKRRYGPKTEGGYLELNEQELFNFIEVSATVAAKRSKNHLLAIEVNEIIREIRFRLIDGRINLWN